MSRRSAEEGFDYHVVGGSAYYAQQEVHDLINVLSVIEDPLDAVALAGASQPVLLPERRRPVLARTSGGGDLAEGSRHADADRSSCRPDGSAARPCGHDELLARWRDLKDRVPIAALVDRVLDESGYEAALARRVPGRPEAGQRAQARPAGPAVRPAGGLHARRLRGPAPQRPAPTPREEQAATTDEEGTSVRLMSIHQAKGLEFPIVVLPDLNRKPSGGMNLVAFHPKLGPLVRLNKDGVPAEVSGSARCRRRRRFGGLGTEPGLVDLPSHRTA